MSSKIDSTAFGEITVEGKKYEEDIKILPSGKILKRFGPKGSHDICLEEFSEILKEGEQKEKTKKPKTIIIGTGQSGVAELEPKAKFELEKKGIKVIEAPTSKAIKIFNETKDPKAGLFHITC